MRISQVCNFERLICFNETHVFKHKILSFEKQIWYNKPIEKHSNQLIQSVL